jgi:hypothetical protein
MKRPLGERHAFQMKIESGAVNQKIVLHLFINENTMGEAFAENTNEVESPTAKASPVRIHKMRSGPVNPLG